MCGLVVLIHPNGGVPTSTLVDMCALIKHRGPDGEGVVVFDSDAPHPMVGPDAPQGGGDSIKEYPGARVGLGHRRLSIVDVSAGGHQPMADEDERYWIVYNGEIYNHIELRNELEDLGYVFHSHSDTEVLLAAWAQWESDCLERLNGMFSFVIYDRQTDTIYAVRDRFGVKPLYWWRAPDGTLALASEIKAFTAVSGWRAVLNGQMAYDFLVWGLTDHTTQTLFDGVRQVSPGGMLTISVKAVEPVLSRWFELKPNAGTPTSFAAAAKVFKDKFMNAVKVRLRADVPVGTALSGGLDSSSIVCAVNELWDGAKDGDRNAFSARARDVEFDEGPFMDVVVQQTNVVHHVTWPDADGFLKDLENMVWYHDEPFGSASIYAEWKVFAKVAETPVKVTLDGHGADETLVGYTEFIGPQMGAFVRRFKFGALMREWRAQRSEHGRSPMWMAAMIVDDLAPDWLRNLLRRITGRTHPRPDWVDVDRLRAEAVDPFNSSARRGQGVLGLSLAQLAVTSLPMQLKWADRDSMAHSIESREPFLDPDVVSYVLGLPDTFKLKDAVTKRVLRSGFKGLLPKLVASRKDKMGFVTPESLWVTRDRPDGFQEAAVKAVDAARGILTPAAIEEAKAITQGHAPFHTRLIRILVFGAWMKRFNVEVDAA